MNSRSSDEIRAAFLSDVHLGHPKTPARHTVKALTNALIKDPDAKFLDLIVIAGDLFDQGLQYTDDSVRVIQNWATRLFRFCAAHQIVVRILEGTPLHDRGQTGNLVELCEGLDVDVSYVNTLSIERLDKLGLDVLYVPDEWRGDPNDTWLEVKQCLADLGLEKVDLAIMHGMFEHQLPPGVKLEPHTAKRYESIVRHYVVIGHIHQPSHRGKILAPGSTDHLTHGDEGRKGHWRVNLRHNPKLNEVVFKENRDALPYKTVDCRGMNFDSGIELVTTTVNSLPLGSHVRIRVRGTDPTAALLEWSKKQYPNLFWTSQRMDEEQDKKSVGKGVVVIKHTAIALTPTTLPGLIEEKLGTLTNDMGLKHRCMEILNAHIAPSKKNESDDVGF